MNILFSFTLIIYTPSSPPFPSFFSPLPLPNSLFTQKIMSPMSKREGSAMTKGRIFDDGDAWGREEAKIVD